MLLKKEINNDEIVSLYKSSNISKSTYNKITNDLIVVFKNGGQYLYENVSESDYTRFEIDDSQGKILNSHIKKYQFKKLENINVESINEEIENLYIITKEIERKELYDKITSLCKEIILCESTPNPTLLVDCRDFINIYLDRYHKLINI